MTGPELTLAEVERLARRRVEERLAVDRLVAAGGFDVEGLTDQARSTLCWLGGWGPDTIAGLVELLTAARAAGRGEEPCDCAHRAGSWYCPVHGHLRS